MARAADSRLEHLSTNSHLFSIDLQQLTWNSAFSGALHTNTTTNTHNNNNNNNNQDQRYTSPPA